MSRVVSLVNLDNSCQIFSEDIRQCHVSRLLMFIALFACEHVRLKKMLEPST
jgi:hypothetical protein